MGESVFGYRLSDEIQKLSKMGGWEYNVETQEVSWSLEVYRIYGVPLGTKFDKANAINFYAPEERVRMSNLMKRGVDKMEPWDEVFRFHDAQGDEKWVRSIGSPVTDEKGVVKKIWGVFQDVTELKERELENKFVLETSHMGLWKWNIVENQLTWDDSLYEIYGLKKKDFPGAFEAWQATIHPDHKEKADQEINSALTLTGKLDTTFKILKPSGEIGYVGARGKVYFDEDGKPLRMLGINWDKTEEINSQLKLDEQKALANVTAKFATIGQLSAGVGHEINNPLAIIKGQFELISMKINSGQVVTNEELIKKCEKVDRAINRIQKIVNGLRTFTKSEQDEGRTFSTNKAIENTLDMVEEIFKKDDIEIIQAGDGFKKDLIAMGSSSSFQQVIMNLLNNAKDALLSEKERVITLSQSVKNGKIELIVSNSGKTIPAEVASKIFDPFFTTKEVGKGTGIGLSVSKNFIEDMGGSLEWVPGPSTAFRILLDCKEEKKASVSAHTAPLSIFESEPQGLKADPAFRVLIVEDEEELALGIQSGLEMFDCEAQWAANGQEAFDLIENGEHPFNLILSDAKMPIMTGGQLFDKIVETQGATRPYFVLMSGAIASELTSNQKNHGESFDRVLSKPFGLNELQKIVEEFQNSDLSKELAKAK